MAFRESSLTATVPLLDVISFAHGVSQHVFAAKTIDVEGSKYMLLPALAVDRWLECLQELIATAGEGHGGTEAHPQG